MMTNKLKKLIIISSIIIIIIILIIFVYKNSPNRQNSIDEFNISSENYQNSYGLNITQKNSALMLVINNQTVNNFIEKNKNDRNFLNKSVGKIIISNTTNYNGTIKVLDGGFFNTSNIIAEVPIRFGDNNSLVTQNYIFYVDLTSNKVLGYDNYGIRIIPLYVDTVIPSNSYWYHQLAGVYTTMPGDYTSIHFQISFNDNYSNVLYPIILDKDNFDNFKNGTSYEPLKYIDFITQENRSFDGNMAINPQSIINGTAIWYSNISISHALPINNKYFQPKFYYVILKNDDLSRDIPIIFVLLI